MKKSVIYKFNRITLMVVFCLIGLIFAQAQTFIGATGNGLWSDSENWLDGIMPDGEFSHATITADVIVDEDVSIGMLFNSGNSSLTIKEGKKLSINYSIDWGDENDFIIEDKAQLLCSTPVQVTVKKRISAYDTDTHAWNLISSPVENDIIPTAENGFFTDPETSYALFSFDEASAQWNNYKDSPFVIKNGRGYLYSNAYDTTLVFEGKTVGAIAGYSLSYYVSNGPLAGYNIKGNPLPCNAYVDRSYYLMNEESNSLIPIALSMSRPIAPCTGIIVMAESSDDHAIRFDCGVAEQPDNKGYVEITAAKSNAPALVLGQALLSFNNGDDLGKVSFFEKAPAVYFTKDNRDLTIFSIDSTNTQSLKFKAGENGSYVLHFELKDLSLDYLHLIDNITGANIDLLTTPSYTFNATTNDYASRFKLVFDPHFGIEEDGPSTDSGTFAYVANGEIVINGIETQDFASLQIIDMTGRVIVCRDAVRHVSTIGIAPGVYVLCLKTSNGVRTQKIVIE